MDNEKPNRPPEILDGANVLFWVSRDTPFYTIPEGNIQHEVMAMAICRYAKDAKVYLFKCDATWDVIMDMDYRSVEAAMAAATQWHVHPHDWRS